MDPRESARVKPLYRASQVVWYILGLIEILLAFRFVLRMFCANAAAMFTSLIYAITAPMVYPFANVFRITRVEGATFEWMTLLAMAIYALIAWGIVKLLIIGKPVSTTEADVKLDRQE